MNIIRSLAVLAASSTLLIGCGQSDPAPVSVVPAAAAEAPTPALDGPCPADRVGSRTVVNDPVLVCTDTSTGPRWILSTAEPMKVELVPTTTTTACQAAAIATALQADQARLDSLVAGRRQAESAVAQIQLVIDNAGRSIDQYRRNQAEAQKAYDQAAAAFGILGTDTAKDKMTAAANNLADWKGIVASWEATRTKALGDLSRGKATLADWDKQISEARQAVATDKAAQETLVCP